MLILQHISYTYPGGDPLFDHIDLSVQRHQKIALVGHNGAGKSTLLKLISGELKPLSGIIIRDVIPYVVPQVFGQYDQLTIAEVLKVDRKLHALQSILAGEVTDAHFEILNDDWTIEERCLEALRYWKLGHLHLSQKMETLSGGQKTKVFLAGISIHQPELILLDEPGNHLDTGSRELLYELLRSTASGWIMVSHDRQLLGLPDTICELGKAGLVTYGGNYDFYAEQKKIAQEALSQELHSREKELRKAKEKARETLERQQRLDARGKKKQEKAGVARIMMNTLRNNAENSTAKVKTVHAEKIGNIGEELKTLRAAMPDMDKMKLGFRHPDLHKGKRLWTAVNVNFRYDNGNQWKDNLDITILSGDRIAVRGDNGSGKTTLMKLIMGLLQPTCGTVMNAAGKVTYIDQDYSLINNKISVYEQAQLYNDGDLQESEIKTRLNRFLFPKEAWNKPCAALSGGERMRLALCCITISNHPPDMLLLDEPTNNLDMESVAILVAAVQHYNGTLIVVSHDRYFLEAVNIEREIWLNKS
ncbi:ABC-F family ATP-binding cassette domain-containing protein [Sediminibacterium ginsengisoli]|uniref:ATPase components of ABC transporters with duplicated ATPase domains n=1 Tax=Sediminibacterium ginsengisoli TaxID=413434 RepID=A0A1T4RR24_9BACT|nr:ABC-F family ATP-binding cassette domain-containing protein [Sediminibacterium ginsengisoli]SKA18414.1 ATPase components of ABC transporters with duplicated ATPase domains [Sediminibacterium ginsengisoli]